jgi:hypothetical protein
MRQVGKPFLSSPFFFRSQQENMFYSLEKVYFTKKERYVSSLHISAPKTHSPNTICQHLLAGPENEQEGSSSTPDYTYGSCDEHLQHAICQIRSSQKQVHTAAEHLCKSLFTPKLFYRMNLHREHWEANRRDPSYSPRRLIPASLGNVIC